MSDNSNQVNNANLRPSRADAEKAVRTLISWIGDDPDREGLVETPKRVVKAYEDYFVGYNIDAKEILSKTFEEIEGYDDIVLIRDISFESHCEHHIAPIIGTAHVAYIPDKRIVGISKIARLVDAFAKRLQTQEIMTSQIANTLNDVLKPKGVAVLLDAKHQCMTTRGVYKRSSSTMTKMMLGCFKEDADLENKFFNLAKFGG